MNNSIKVLCICSENYNDTFKIKELLFNLKNYQDRLIISTYGQDENILNKFIYKVTSLFEYSYREFPRYNKPYNMYCAMPKYKFGKTPHPMLRSIREKDSIEWSDRIFLFINKNDKDQYDGIIKKIKKLNKKYNVFY